MMHGMHGYGYDYGSVWMIGFWIILIGLGIYLLIKFINSGSKINNNSKEISRENKPLLILQERLAKGEIDEMEYERLKNILNEDRE